MILRFLFLFLLTFRGLAQPLADTKVLFLGNSITYDGRYIAYIESWLKSRYPNSDFQFINMGVPSETVSGLSEPNHADGKFSRPVLEERAQRVFEAYRPQLVFACYGMNDGIYMPFDKERFKSFQKGIRKLQEISSEYKARLILLTPPVYDDESNKPYGAVLDRYSEWLLNLKKQEVIDLHFPMKEYLENQKAKQPGFKLASDGVHPGEIGHWLMAKPVLKYLEEPVGEIHEPPMFLTDSDRSQRLVELTLKKQRILRDAWLSKTGHQRPGLAAGQSIEVAEAMAGQLEKEIADLLKQ